MILLLYYVKAFIYIHKTTINFFLFNGKCCLIVWGWYLSNYRRGFHYLFIVVKYRRGLKHYKKANDRRL